MASFSRCFLTVLLIIMITFAWASTSPLLGENRQTQHGSHFRRMKSLDTMSRKFSSPHIHPKDDANLVANNVVHVSTKQSASLPEKNRKNKYTGYKCRMGQNSNGNGLAIIEADPYDCSKYYYCVWGVEKVSQCPALLLWNNRDKACDWFWNVDCENRGRRSLWSLF